MKKQTTTELPSVSKTIKIPSGAHTAIAMKSIQSKTSDRHLNQEEVIIDYIERGIELDKMLEKANMSYEYLLILINKRFKS